MTRLFFKLLFGGMALSVYPTMAGNLTLVSDTISESGIGLASNHTVRFTTINAIPASGKIIITPQSGVFTIPATLDYTDIDFIVDGVNKSLAALPGATAGSLVGVTMTSGTSGSIILVLNGTDSIAAGSAVVIKIGTNAVFELAGSRQIQNPALAGSYSIGFQTQNFAGIGMDSAIAMVAILPGVGTGSSTLAPSAPVVSVRAGGEGGNPATVNAIASSMIPSAYTEKFISTIFGRSLAVGSRGEDVERLQQVLGLDRQIYSAEITGYFGLLTRAAIINFQLRYKIIKGVKDVGAGIFGPITRAKVQSLFGRQLSLLMPIPGATASAKITELRGRLDILKAQIQALLKVVPPSAVVKTSIRPAITLEQKQDLTMRLVSLRGALQRIEVKR